VSEDRGRSFDRKVEDALVARLQAGHEPEALLAELRTRLGDAEADAVLTRAEARVSRQRRASMSPAMRIVAGVAYLWTGVLVLQNLMVLGTLLHTPDGIRLFLPNVAFALLKIGALCLGVFVFRTWRSALTTILYAGAILYAFPLGLFVESLFSEFAARGDASILLSVSALVSYAVVFLIAVLYWRERENAPRGVAANAFD
jgi:hypothetical protein